MGWSGTPLLGNQTNHVFDFTNVGPNLVIWVSGDVSNPTVIGSGTIIAEGNISFAGGLGTAGQPVYVVSQQSVSNSTDGFTYYGGIYAAAKRTLWVMRRRATTEVEAVALRTWRWVLRAPNRSVMTAVERRARTIRAMISSTSVKLGADGRGHRGAGLRAPLWAKRGENFTQFNFCSQLGRSGRR